MKSRSLALTVRFAAFVCAAAVFAAAPRPAAADEAEDAERRAAELAAKEMKSRRETLEKAATEQFARTDKNNDGTLKGAELPQGWKERYDRDGDGDVTRTEFVEVSARPEKLRLLHPMRDPAARAADMIASFDQDKNGQIERKEYPGDDVVFRKADRNKDEALAPKEVRSLADDEIAGIEKQMRNPGRYDFYQLFDIDKNGMVTPDEYDGSVAVFRKFDTDKDGQVTYAELFPERMKAMVEEKKEKAEDLNAIETLDADKDGKVARAEFKGGDAAWARLDKNCDGFLTSADR